MQAIDYAMQSLTHVAAPAKVNLFLHVTGRRPDGYHLLQSVFVLVDWQDTLHFERRTDSQIRRHDLGAKLPEIDLCLRAAQLLQAESGCSTGADISIEKSVPWGAGLGGGSSDAASTLIGLNRLWGLHWSRRQLAALGLRLGADVPFFLGRGNALVEGVGEQLTPCDVPPTWLAVLKPAAALETRAVFTHPILKQQLETAIILGSSLRGEEVHGQSGKPLGQLAVEGWGRNDLEPCARALCREVDDAKRMLDAAFGNSRMTGSGSAVFARAGMGSEPLAEIPAPLPQAWVGRMCQSLTAHPLADWLEA